MHYDQKDEEADWFAELPVPEQPECRTENTSRIRTAENRQQHENRNESQMNTGKDQETKDEGFFTNVSRFTQSVFNKKKKRRSVIPIVGHEKPGLPKKGRPAVHEEKKEGSWLDLGTVQQHETNDWQAQQNKKEPYFPIGTFTRQARKWEDKEAKPCQMVPFRKYWPSYEDFSREQAQWYLYWRSQWREGHALDTDTSYLYVYIYELINGVGWDDPQQGFLQLFHIWKSYRSKHDSLDKNMAEWMFDFALLHKLTAQWQELLDWMIDEKVFCQGVVRDALFMRIYHSQPIHMTYYWAQETAVLAKNTAQERLMPDLEESIPILFASLDRYCQQNKNVRFGDSLGEVSLKRVRRQPYPSAIYDCRPRQYDVLRITSLSYGDYPPLKYQVHEILRAAENELREWRGVRGRLRNIDLPVDLQGFIKSFYQHWIRKHDYLMQEKKEAAEKEKRKITIDWAQLEALQDESKAVTEILSSPLEEESESSVVEENINRGNQPNQILNANASQREEDDTWVAWQRQMVRALANGKEKEANQIAVDQGLFLDMAIDDVNEKSLAQWGDLLFVGHEINEDLRELAQVIEIMNEQN